jgi:short-subunit dehydrogenase
MTNRVIIAASLCVTKELPLCVACKHGVLGFVCSIVQGLAPENTRVRAVLPGQIRTSPFDHHTWSYFDQKNFTPVELIVETVVGSVGDRRRGG